MFEGFRLFPDQASTVARDVDLLYFFMIAVTGAAVVVVCSAILYFAVRYRRRSDSDWPTGEEPHHAIEYVWIIVPFFVFMVMFFWGAKLYFHTSRPPDGALDVYVTGRQWMWKFQHVGGQSEINALHVPVGRPVRLIMASEDVIHSMYFPAFRTKMDVLPNRFTVTWFEATRAGRYHLFCTEYCGTLHSGMIGEVTVMEPDEYQKWLAGGATEGSLSSEGKKAFETYACNTCHMTGNQARGPDLAALFGSRRSLRDGRTVVADENYIRESITNPQAKIVAGYEPIMPTFQGQLNEAQLMQLVAYVKSLRATGGTEPVESPASLTTNAGTPEQRQ